jgi:hypothetical protein
MPEYVAWITGPGMKQVLTLQGLQEVKAFREHTTLLTPRIMAMLFFIDLRPALQAASSDAWLNILSNLTRLGAPGVELTVLEPSPLFPKALLPS